VVPKVVLVVCAILVFAHLFWSLAHPKPVPRPVRVGLLHVAAERDPASLLRGGLALPSPWELARAPVARQLDHPLGSEGGALTYNARPFREADHLGEDLNGIGGGNSDLGDPVFAAGDGLVLYAGHAGGGWGNVVLLQHRSAEGGFFQTFYGHLDRIDVPVGRIVPRGGMVGTVGTADGQYLAHLHFEIRQGFHLDLGSGYSPFPLNRIDGEAALRSQARSDPALLHPGPGTVAGETKEPRPLRWTGLPEAAASGVPAAP
jgi:hypothetical protein